MKTKTILIITTLITLFSLSFFAYSQYKTLHQQLDNCLKIDSTYQVPSCVDEIYQLQPTLSFLQVVTKPFIKINQPLTQLNEILDTLAPFTPHLDYFLGLNDYPPINYTILLQNNNELRPTGGFLGSFLKLHLSSHQPPQFQLQDIYVPDGQIQGHVEPPLPIQQAFGQGWYRLRDSNWEPDFPTGSNSIRWFMEKGGEINPNNLIAINFSTLTKMLEITGPLDLPTYNLEINSDNSFLTIQNLVEQDFFPGSTQKKDTLTALTQALTERLTSLTLHQKLDLVSLLLDELNHQNIQVNSTSPDISQILREKNWDGKLAPLPAPNDYLNDTLAIIEANLGANKANCCLDRQTTHQITKDDQYLYHQVTIDYTNSSPQENPDPPHSYGGNYIDYLRLYLPLEAVDINISASPSLPIELETYPQPLIGQLNLGISKYIDYDFQKVGFFHITRAQSQSQITFSYKIPLNHQKNYQLGLIKQTGIDSSSQTINLFGKTTTIDLTNDYLLQSTLE